MKWLVYLVSLIAVVGFANAAVYINEFTVDPQQDWDNSSSVTSSDEWFEFYNSGSSAVDLSGYKLLLLDTTNETELLQGTIAGNGYLVVLNPAGQQNNEGILELYDQNGKRIDRIAYGNGGDAPDGNADSVENECLAKVDGKFVKQKCTKGYSNDVEKGSSLKLEIKAVIEGSAATIYSVEIETDDSSADGIQISPVPGSDKKVGFNAVADKNCNLKAEILRGDSKLYETGLESSEEDGSKTKYKGEFKISYDKEPGIYTLKVTASSDDGTTTASKTFEYLSLIGIEMDASSLTFSDLAKGETSYIEGDDKMSTKDKPTIKNIGNVKVDLEISGTDLKNNDKKITVGNIKYKLGNSDYKILGFDPVANKIGLTTGKTTDLNIGLSVPESIAAGTYTGSILITALK